MTEKSFSSSSLALIQVEDNYKMISENISKALMQSGRSDKVRLMAVTKTVPYEKVNYAVSLGITLLGENRVQEFLEKNEFYDKNCEIHFIGGLQNNKVKYIIDKVDMIHSLDSFKLADEINRRASACSRTMNVLIEVNIGKEPSKGGVPPEGIDELAAYCRELGNINLKGFMAIPPPNIDGSSDNYFRLMEKIYQDYRSKYGDGIDTLSMGMSGDYEAAVRYGSNIVRIGSALFGSRK
ncbi:MAG: YggS family pyridoxal phosphate-dependent enzyme [Firmicutes bacterium]|nr:YggS family pyridoxal phosphate-dependent enzyme [[Eubacterium] siraeum]MCM1486908.1 YggS family pyridoxal phosphate-dependent enzyme [Bacillota bacterium]